MDQQSRDKETAKDALIKKYESTIADLQKENKVLELKFKTKNALINTQNLKIKDLELKQRQNLKVNNHLVMPLLDTMNDEFEALHLSNKGRKESAFDDEKIAEFMDRQEDIVSKIGLLQKQHKEQKRSNKSMEEAMDGLNENGERYFEQTIRKMGDHYSQLNSSIRSMDMGASAASNG